MPPDAMNSVRRKNQNQNQNLRGGDSHKWEPLVSRDSARFSQTSREGWEFTPITQRFTLAHLGA